MFNTDIYKWLKISVKEKCLNYAKKQYQIKLSFFTSYPIGDFFTFDNFSSSFQSSCLASTVNLAHQYLKVI